MGGEFESVRSSTVEGGGTPSTVRVARAEMAETRRNAMNPLYEEDEEGDDEDVIDESGADDAFVAGELRHALVRVYAEHCSHPRDDLRPFSTSAPQHHLFPNPTTSTATTKGRSTSSCSRADVTSPGR